MQKHFGLVTALSAFALSMFLPSGNRFEQAAGDSALPVGTVVAHVAKLIPDGWVEANGDVLPSQQKYQKLCEILANQFTLTTDPIGTCRLPNLMGRVPVGAGRGIDGSSQLSERNVGQRFGAERKELSVAEMPSHVHGLSELKGKVATNTPGWAVAAQRDTVGPLAADYNTDKSGGGQAFELSQPSLVLRFIVKL